MSNCNEYKNKLFSILGDSVSTFEGYSQPKSAVFYDLSRKMASGVLTPPDTWWGQVLDHLGGELLVNNSFSGSTVCQHPLYDYEIQSYGCSDERTSSLHRDTLAPDVIIAYMGTNDWGCGFKVFEGEPGFYASYSKMIEKLKNNYPGAEIWCFTLPVSKCSLDTEFEFPYYYGGRNISEYCEAIRLCAKEFNCRLIDLNKRCEPYDTLDGFHPNACGMKTIAEAVINELNNE